jgi:hypothetical protein
MCEQCNHTKDAPGWGGPARDENGVHTPQFATHTGARYRSTAPPLPGPPVIAISEVAARIGVAIVDAHAA